MVRIAVREELERVNELRQQVSKVHSDGRPDLFRDSFDTEMREQLDQMWQAENQDVFVAIKNDTICGYGCMEYIERPMTNVCNPRKYVHVMEFGVDESCKRQGIGRELLLYMKQYAKEKGFHRLELDVLEFNESALKFYESIGFKTYRRIMEFDEQ